MSTDELKVNNNIIKPNVGHLIHLPTAIKGFLSGKSQSGGGIIQIIDLDGPPNLAAPDLVEKYLVLQMENGIVVLQLKYHCNKDQ